MELVKRNDRYDLFNVDGHKIASTLNGCANKLSLKNCESIVNDFDLYPEAVDYAARQGHPSPEGFSDEQVGLLHGYIDGFQKAIEILGDKKFSEEDMINFSEFVSGKYINQHKFLRDKSLKGFFITAEILKEYQSLQQTEWDVEIEMEELPYSSELSEEDIKNLEIFVPQNITRPKLDDEGCLIIKRI